TLPCAPEFSSSPTIVFVFGASSVSASITNTLASCARTLYALRRASHFTCFGTSWRKLRFGRGPKTLPPPRQWGERVEPWRARPVPFCRQGLLLPPETCARVFVDAVPWRWFARYAFTTCHIAASWTVPSNSTSGSSRSPLLAPSALKAGALNMDAIVFLPVTSCG